jgi:hypothetical protein
MKATNIDCYQTIGKQNERKRSAILKAAIGKTRNQWKNNEESDGSTIRKATSLNLCDVVVERDG